MCMSLRNIYRIENGANAASYKVPKRTLTYNFVNGEGIPKVV